MGKIDAKNSNRYKMSYYNYASLFPPGQARNLCLVESGS